MMTVTDATLAVVASEPPQSDRLAPGDVVGRYLVVSELGAGGMGVVYAAYDPELDRRVALKLMLPGSDVTRRGSAGGSRLLREAQALARLQHPNVVTIHDVGTYGGRVWLAMEYVDGCTLRAWRDAAPRAWPDVLDVLVRAGRGVAAAHAAGLLHRDLKPDNIMVADDGRVRVMDFGLARVDARDREGSTHDDPPIDGGLDSLSQPITRDGALLGTPAYMAPEQLQAMAAVSASDQFSFCVTLWEALYGARPFVATSLIDLTVAVLEGRITITSPPAGHHVPTWLRRIIERGLAVDPQARWPSMDALLDALVHGRRAATRRRALAASGALVVATAGVFGWHALERRDAIARCEATGASISDVWNDQSRDALRAALLATNVAYAKTAERNVIPRLDAHASAWRAAATEACTNAEVGRTWDADTSARASFCLDERHMQFEALVAELSHGGAKAVEMSVRAAAALADVAPCVDVDSLRLTPTPPDEDRDRVRAVKTELARAHALRRTGAYADGLAVARTALDQARDLGWPPLVASASYTVGVLCEHTGSFEESEAALETAYFTAAKAGAAEIASAAADNLAFTVGYRLGRHAEGIRWSRLADVELATLPDADGVRRANHLFHVARVHWANGSYAEAKALHEQVIAVREATLGSDHPELARSLGDLASVQMAMGAYDEAERLYERALAIWLETLGPDHPDISVSLNNLASVHQYKGDHAQARVLYERALASAEASLGVEHPNLAAMINNLAVMHRDTGDYETARALNERALAIREKALGPEHPNVAASLTNLAATHASMGSYDEAETLYRRALAIEEKTIGVEHADYAATLTNFGIVRYKTGAYEAAKELHERALAITENALGPEHPNVASVLFNLADVQRALGSTDAAERSSARASRIREKVLGRDRTALANR